MYDKSARTSALGRGAKRGASDLAKAVMMVSTRLQQWILIMVCVGNLDG